MLLGFYDRNGDGLAVEITPEMAKAIKAKSIDIFATVKSFDCFSSSSEIRLTEFALDRVYLINRYDDSENEPSCEFFEIQKALCCGVSSLESTGAWIDIQEYRALGGEPTVFWELYGLHGREATPFLTLAQLDAIANIQPLPQE
jgi:hypothetical protein